MRGMEHAELNEGIVEEVEAELRVLEEAAQTMPQELQRAMVTTGWSSAESEEAEKDETDEPEVSVSEGETPAVVRRRAPVSETRQTLEVVVNALGRLSESIDQVRSLVQELLEQSEDQDDVSQAR